MLTGWNNQRMKTKPLEVKPKYVYWIHSIKLLFSLIKSMSKCLKLAAHKYKMDIFLLNDDIFYVLNDDISAYHHFSD